MKPPRPGTALALFVCFVALVVPRLRADGGSPTTGNAAAPLAGVHAGLACRECHGTDATLSRFDPASPLSRPRVASTCGACHEKERDAYAISSHSQALAKGNGSAPTCVSCHGAHNILAVSNTAASVAPGNLARTCGDCHEDPAILRGSALPYDAVEGYEATLHGVALTHGISDVATCASCHGAHDILPGSDPRSWVSPAHLGHTCGTCHSEVTAGMIEKVTHHAGPPREAGLFERLRVYLPVAGATVNPLLISGMGALVGFLSGLFGVGGGFLMTPLLIFIGIPAAVAAATDAAQITAGATSGALSHSRLGNVDFKMGVFIVAGGWAGGVVGVQLVKVLRNLGNFDFFLKFVYVVVLGFIGTTMFLEGLRAWRGRGHAGEPRRSKLTLFFSRLPLQVHFPKSGLDTSLLLPFGAGFLVGVLAAFLGVGGGFIMLPTMIYIIGIPTRVAVGTDLFQIVLTSANVTLQQAITNHTVDVLLAVMLFLGSVIGAQFGVMVSRRLRGEQIRVFLAGIVMVVMVILLVQLLTPPAHLIDFAKSGGGH
ncbi:MAG: TSUP family transporter [Acidobacteriota bacterium]